MYSLRQLIDGIRHPDLVRKEVNRHYYRWMNDHSYNDDGVDVFEEDWDNLIILDACRYDLFSDRNILDGALERKESRASDTEEFLRANFHQRTLHDVVYVTGNPQLYRKEIDTSLHAVRHVWQDDGWDHRFRTVHPATMTKRGIEAAREFPNKRLVIHYMQPHYPFIGPTGQNYFDLESLAFWDRVESGEIPVSNTIIEQAYEENLDVALPYVKELLEELAGKTVVTSDHGQMLGERAGILPRTYYGHPPGLYHPTLVGIPWLVQNSQPRREIYAEEPTEREDVDADETTVQERLNQLGYA